MDMVWKDAERTGGWCEYQALCGLIKLLADFGGRAKAKAMISEHLRRPALLDELGRV